MPGLRRAFFIGACVALPALKLICNERLPALGPLHSQMRYGIAGRAANCRNRLILQEVRTSKATLPAHQLRQSFSPIAICNKCEQRRADFLDKLTP